MYIEDLDLGELIDVAEATLFEPVVHSGGNVDEALDKWDARLREVFADELTADEVFAGPEFERNAAAWEAMMPPSVIPDVPGEESDTA